MKKEVSLVFRGVTLHSPLISVVLVTRQHADTLRLRLDGILNQRTTFDTEVVIVDRGSNDGTGDICQEYKALYPDKVRFYTRVPGDFPEKSRIIRLRGDLGIICRDEELWSDIFKLQRQGTFLMTHPEYDLCFHNVRGSNIIRLCFVYQDVTQHIIFHCMRKLAGIFLPDIHFGGKYVVSVIFIPKC